MLGPLLFLVYINDMPEGINSTVRLFADDSLVYRIIQSKEDQTILQEDLRKLQEWEQKWQMQFNTDKCEVLRITKRKNPTICNYSLYDQHLQTVKQAKYLGATISSDLSWNQHVDNTVKKATNSLNLIRRNIWDCPPRVKEQCYKTLVCPTMEYASCVWDPYTNTNIKKLEMVQRRAARFVKGDYDRTSSVTAMLDELKATMFYRIVYGLVCVPSTPFLISTLVSATRGHDMKFLVPQSSTM